MIVILSFEKTLSLVEGLSIAENDKTGSCNECETFVVSNIFDCFIRIDSDEKEVSAIFKELFSGSFIFSSSSFSLCFFCKFRKKFLSYTSIGQNASISSLSRCSKFNL